MTKKDIAVPVEDFVDLVVDMLVTWVMIGVEPENAKKERERIAVKYEKLFGHRPKTKLDTDLDL